MPGPGLPPASLPSLSDALPPTSLQAVAQAQHLQGLEATEATEHAPVHHLQLVPCQHQLLHAHCSIKGALSHLLDLVVTQVSRRRGQMGQDRCRQGVTGPAANPWSEDGVGSSALGSQTVVSSICARGQGPPAQWGGGRGWGLPL